MEQVATKVVTTLRGAGFEAYFAGGAVRNQLLGLPVNDIDITTSAHPEEIEKLFPRTYGVGRAFGVILVMQGKYKFEVATFRSDAHYEDGRRPTSVTYSDLESDVLRRDFTVNGMMYDPVEKKIIDLVDGQKDLKNRVLRSIGDPRKRFDEDKLRLLRAIRFATLLQFEIEENTWKAIGEMASTIKIISAERITKELQQILVAPDRARGCELLHQSGLLKEILPEVAAMEGVEQPKNFHPEGDVWAHTKLAMAQLDHPTFEVALATLLHDVGKPPTFQRLDRIRFNRHEKVGAEMAQDISSRLRLSNAEKDRISWLVEKHMVFHQLPGMKESKLRRLISHRYFPDLEQVHRADALASNKDLSIFAFLKKVREEMAKIVPEPLLTGRDLIDLGWKPGKRFKEVLHAAMDLQLEGTLQTKEEAISFARRQKS